MVTFLTESLPLRQIIGPLLLNVGLCVCTMRSVKLLSNWVLNLDSLDSFVKRRQGVDPDVCSQRSDFSTLLVFGQRLAILSVE